MANQPSTIKPQKSLIASLLWVASMMTAAIIIGSLIMGIARGEVNSEVSAISYTGNSSTKTFTFPFGILSTSQLRVVVRTVATGAETLLVLNSGYSMTDDDADGDYTDGPGGSITTLATSAYSSAYEICLSRAPALTQTRDIDGTLYLRMGVLEDAIDNLTYEVQYLRRMLYRVPMIPETEAQVADMNVPNSVNRASAFLKFTAAGGLTTATTTDATMTGFWSTRTAADTNAAEARAGLGAQGLTDHSIDLYEPDVSGTNHATITVPAMAADVNWTWPDAASVGWLKSDINGALTVETPAGAGDMLAATYDVDVNGVVDAAELAQHATFAENVDANDYGEVTVSAAGVWTIDHLVTPYDSGWFAANHATAYTKAHSLGAVPTMVQVWASDSADGSGAVTILGAVTGDYGANNACIYDVDATNIKVRVSTALAYYRNAAGTPTTITDGYMRITAILVP